MDNFYKIVFGLFAVIVIAAFLAGCGGGGDDVQVAVKDCATCGPAERR